MEKTLAEYKLLFDYYKKETGKDSIYYETMLAYPMPAGADTLLLAGYRKKLVGFSQPSLAGTSLNERRTLFEGLAAMVSKTISSADLMIAHNDAAYFSTKEKITAPDVDNGQK